MINKILWSIAFILMALTGFKISINGNCFEHIGLLEQILNHISKK